MKKRTSAEENYIQSLTKSGISLPDLNQEKTVRENRLKICFWNAVLTALFLISVTGIFMDAFSLPGNRALIFTFEAGLSLYLSFLYYSSLAFNLGYLLLLAGVGYTALCLYRVANSGFSAIMNLMIAKVDEIMMLPGIRVYQEFVTDRERTITVCICLFSVVVACLFNMWISRRKDLTAPLFVVFLHLEMSIYLTDFFPKIYVCGLLLAVLLYAQTVINDGQPAAYRKIKPYRFKNHKLELTGNKPDIKGTLCMSVFLLLLCILLYTAYDRLANPMYPNTTSRVKTKTDDLVYDLAWHGVSSLFFRNGDTGGMDHGSFGDVGTVMFDGKDDLQLTFTPYTNAPIYLVSYAAEEYDSQARRWVSQKKSGAEEYEKTYEMLLEAQKEKKQTAARAYMVIKNVDAARNIILSPYYTNPREEKLPIFPEYSVGYEFYPLLDSYTGLIKPQAYTEEIADLYRNNLKVPEAILPQLQEICQNEGFGGSTDEIIRQIQSYMAENLYYTLSPGGTPAKKDFVLYFLQEKKKGFCVHFASAACLLLRTMGIPARYAEGYCIDAKVYADATIHEENELIFPEPSDGIWYEGYNPLGNDRVIDVSVTDEYAHAWVEVYLEGVGFVPVEFTLGNYDTQGNAFDLLNQLRMLGNTAQTDTASPFDAVNRMMESDVMKEIGRIFSASFTHILEIFFVLLFSGGLLYRLRTTYRLYYVRGDHRAIYQYRVLEKLVVQCMHFSETKKKLSFDEMQSLLEQKMGIPSKDVHAYLCKHVTYLYRDNKTVGISKGERNTASSRAEELKDLTKCFIQVKKMVQKQGTWWFRVKAVLLYGTLKK